MTRIGPYRLEDRLGAGGMGVVYRAYDERLARQVAIKVLRPGRDSSAIARERLRREARACARLSHPAIVQIFDLVQEGDAEAIVMELVEGRTLAEHLREGALDPARAISIACDVAEALAEAHDHGIIHRDLKTENVLITPAGRAKILDFGVAKQILSEEASLTDEGMVIGTARSMSPEQAWGQEADPRSDLFSLGVLLYEIFTGESPFLARTAPATLERVCTHLQPPAVSRAPSLARELSDLIDRLLEKDPGRRPFHARQVAQALRSLAPNPASPGPDDSGGITIPMAAGRRPDAPPAFRTDAERRHVTVLSCNLTWKTGEALDPADLPDAMDRLEGIVVATVQHFDGQVERDDHAGWRVFFGYPRAHEDDARRAVFAGLELMPRIAAAGLAGKIGISTGPLIVVRTPLGEERVLGYAPERAMALRRRAAPGTVLVGPQTSRLVEGYFELVEELSPPAPRDSSGAQRVYQARASSGAHNRIHAAGRLTPLVGRDQDMGLLIQRWDLAQEGYGQVVLLSGEAGLGKSRLVWELRQRIGAGTLWLEGHASPFRRDSAFHPILQWLDQWIGIEPHEAPELRLARLEQRLAACGLPVEETLPFLAALLNLPAGDRWPLPPMSPEAQRCRTLETLFGWIVAMAESRPLLLLVEDLHWIDPSSLELLGRLAAEAGALPLLLLITFRPEAAIAWDDKSHVTRLSLAPLTRPQSLLMIEQLTGESGLDPALRDQISARTDGVPLFVEELSRMLLESAGELYGVKLSDIPSSLAGWLGARLDRLDSARQVAQLASVLGREFSAEILEAVAPWDAATLRREVDRLVAADILHRQGFGLRCRYRFKHALLQDAAYDSLLRAERQRFHLRIADTLTDRFLDIAETQPELPAHHYTEAGVPERALPLWQKSGDNAIRKSGFREAVSLFDRALSLLLELPETTERHQREISLQVTRGVALSRLGHDGLEHVHQVYLRAWQLCPQVRSSDMLPVLRGLYAHFLIRGEVVSALAVGEELVTVAQQENDPFFLLTAYEGTGLAHLYRGDPERAREHLERSLSHLEAHLSSRGAIIPGAGDPAVESYSNLSWALWLLGYPDAALAQARAGIELAEKGSHPMAQSFALHYVSKLHLFRRETREGCAAAEKAVSIAREQGLVGWGIAASLNLGGALIADGRLEEGTQVLQEALAGTGVEPPGAAKPMLLAPLAEASSAVGDPSRGLAIVDDALACSAETGQHFFDSELWRLRAAFLDQQGAAAEEIEGALQRALEIARHQSARSLELRAATDLARLWADQDRRAEARKLLAGIYGWFTEGFDTGDLRAARELLAAL